MQRGDLYMSIRKEAVNVQAGILRWETGANCKFRNWKSENIGFLFFMWQPFSRMSFELSKSKKTLTAGTLAVPSKLLIFWQIRVDFSRLN